MPANGDPTAFGEQILTLLDQGRFTATYKLAVLLALIDLCLENSKPDGSAPDFVTTRQLAEKVLEIYWPHTVPFAAASRAKVLRQNAGGQAEILSAITKFRERQAADPFAPIWRSRQSSPRRFEQLRDYVEWKQIEMPLPRLQQLGDTENRFPYEIGWTVTVKRRDTEQADFDHRIRFAPGASAALIQFAGLLRPLIQREWIRMVATLNSDVVDDSRLDEFLFGCQRISMEAVREPLRELQNNRCFYCDTRISAAAEVDHFLPWSRHPDNGIENLVVTDSRCNSYKRDFLAAAEHVRRWTDQRFGAKASDLGEIAGRLSWPRHPEQTIAVVRTIYLRLPERAKLWFRGRDFVDADMGILQQVLSGSEGLK